jgi:hypothetical protein
MFLLFVVSFVVFTIVITVNLYKRKDFFNSLHFFLQDFTEMQLTMT